MRKAWIVFALLLCPAAGHAETQWDHNGSVVTLHADGAKRQFNYLTPRAGLPVTSGTLLFSGQKNGDSYFGTAYVFSSKCGAIGYSVSGPVAPDQRSVTMSGRKPRRNGSCRVVGYEDDILVFTFIDPEANIASQNTEDEGVETLVCLYPVFAEERKLQAEINGNRATTEWVASAINYLRAKYCRTIPKAPEYDDSTSLDETCVQHTGMFRGERVYWGGCYE